MKSLNNSPISLTQKIASLSASFLRLIPPEEAHHLAGFFLKKGALPFNVSIPLDPSFDLSSKLLAPKNLTHPIGLAAGFDKNAEFLLGLKKLGFSFIEVGAATPQPQTGNPKPRIFRLKEQKALINRMGFNNVGIETIDKRLVQFFSSQENLPVALNIGVNKTTFEKEALSDYIKVLQASHSNLSYYSINLSSPNTATLKFLCNKDSIKTLSTRIHNETNKPLNKIWIKLGPNLDKDFFSSIVNSVAEFNFAGLILTNTYPVDLPEKGGLSGGPLLKDSNKALEWAWEVHNGKLPTIAVGGIQTGQDIFDKIARGADLVQIYTAFIYRGPCVVQFMLEELKCKMKEKGFKNLRELKGSYFKQRT